MRNQAQPIINMINKYGVDDPDIMGSYGLVLVLTNLHRILKEGVKGDVVELGCYNGGTSFYIQRMLGDFGSKKEFHVYDSWEGLPERSESDGEGSVKKGDCLGDLKKFQNRFSKFRTTLPILHRGWFKNIPDEKYPDKICFAFFDGDFYQSIMDSFHKVYNKVESGGLIVVHDFGQKELSGVEKACKEYLKHKPEEVVSGNIITENTTIEPNIGIMVKK